MSCQPSISVITVCLNVETVIESTLRSVTEQSHPHIEYIVIDGGSSDRTMEIVNRYKSKISKLVSEKDEGLYFAMNKGLELSTGTYVCFINAGDHFYSSDTLERLQLSVEDADMVFGETMLINQEGRELGLRSQVTTHALPDQVSIQTLRHGLPCSHQSILVRRSKCPKYNTQYRIGADYDWIINTVKRSKNSRRVDLPISAFQTDGLSSQFWMRSLKERFLIQARQFGLVAALGNHLYILFRGLKQAMRGGRLR